MISDLNVQLKKLGNKGGSQSIKQKKWQNTDF